MSQCKPQVRVVSRRYWDRDLRTYVSRGIGYRAFCGEHFRGPVRGRYSRAKADAREHRAEWSA